MSPSAVPITWTGSCGRAPGHPLAVNTWHNDRLHRSPKGLEARLEPPGRLRHVAVPVGRTDVRRALLSARMAGLREHGVDPSGKALGLLRRGSCLQPTPKSLALHRDATGKCGDPLADHFSGRGPLTQSDKRVMTSIGVLALLGVVQLVTGLTLAALLAFGGAALLVCRPPARWDHRFASGMGPLPGTTSTDLAMMDHAVPMVKEPDPAVPRR